MRNDIRDRLVAEAREWLGTPWRPYGRTKGEAADCIFLEEVGRVVCGFKGRHYGYSMLPKDRHLERYANKELRIVTRRVSDERAHCGIEVNMMLPGDLALFRDRNPNEPQHFGMIAIHPSLPHVRTLIHANGNMNGGRVVEHSVSNSKMWMRRLWALYTFPGVEW